MAIQNPSVSSSPLAGSDTMRCLKNQDRLPLKSSMNYARFFMVATALACVSACETRGSISQQYTLGGLSAPVADNDPMHPTISSQTVSDMAGLNVSKIEVSLSLSGGWIGDLYAILTHDGMSSVLLNRVGRGDSSLYMSSFGYSNPGLNNVTFSDSAANGDIHLFGQTLTTLASSPAITSNPTLSRQIQKEIVARQALSSNWGSWAPDGRHDPSQSDAGDARTSLLSGFNDMTANGTWDLMIFDCETTFVTTLNGWTLSITGDTALAPFHSNLGDSSATDFSSVPEPSTYLAGLSALGMLGLFGWRSRK